MNCLDSSHLEPFLADNVTYTSQWVMDDMEGKGAYLDYIRPKLNIIRKSGERVWAEIGLVGGDSNKPCVLLAQGAADNFKATLLITTERDKIRRMVICLIPTPSECLRTGEIPMPSVG